MSHLAVQPFPALSEEKSSAFNNPITGKSPFALNEILLDCYFYFENPILGFCLT